MMKMMKPLNYLIPGVLVGTLFLASCAKNNSKAEKMTANLVNYVDSINNVQTENAMESWSAIEDEFKMVQNKATNEIDKLEDKIDFEEKIKNAELKYETLRQNIMAQKEKLEAQNQKNKIKKTLLGSNYVDGDMTFKWINKDNILSVYENFVNTVQKNKDSYSREDWDEIKLLYEAIDSRKNTVENEGLSSADNIKIAGLKLKFAPLYTVNRMSAKSEENAKAKQ